MIAWPNEMTRCAYTTVSAVCSCMFLCVPVRREFRVLVHILRYDSCALSVSLWCSFCALCACTRASCTHALTSHLMFLLHDCLQSATTVLIVPISLLLVLAVFIPVPYVLTISIPTYPLSTLYPLLRSALSTLYSALHSSLRSALCTLNSALHSAPSTPPWILRSIHPACYLFSSAAYIL